MRRAWGCLWVWAMAGMGAGAPASNGGWSLGQGKLSLEVPAGFELMSSVPDGSRLTCRAGGAGGGGGTTLVSVEVTRVLAGAAGGAGGAEGGRKKVAEGLLGKLRREGKVMGAETVAPAAVVADDKVVAKVIDTIDVEGRRSSRMRAVRVVAGFSVEMYVVATDPGDGKREEMLTAAEERILLRIEAAGPARAAAAERPAPALRLARSGLSLVPPAGWVAETPDAADGVVAVFKVVGQPGIRIAVVRVPVAPTSGGNGEGNGAVTDELLSAALERARMLEEGALGLPAPLGDPQRVQDGRFYARYRRTAGAEKTAAISDSRSRQVGGAIVSVAMCAPAGEEAQTARVADEVALSLGGK